MAAALKCLMVAVIVSGLTLNAQSPEDKIKQADSARPRTIAEKDCVAFTVNRPAGAVRATIVDVLRQIKLEDDEDGEATMQIDNRYSTNDKIYTTLHSRKVSMVHRGYRVWIELRSPSSGTTDVRVAVMRQQRPRDANNNSLWRSPEFQKKDTEEVAAKLKAALGV